MPELPEVETVRRNLEGTVRGRVIAGVTLSGKKLRTRVPSTLGRRTTGRRVVALGRHGKYLLIELDGGLTLLSHLGMSGRWLFFEDPPGRRLPHVHVRMRFEDGTELWFQDPRRFGLLRLVETGRLDADPALRILGPDPVATPPNGEGLHRLARGARVAVKNFLLDQKRVAGIGNIYASEILFRAAVDPRRRAGRVTGEEWDAIARATVTVLGEAIARMGTTFSAYRTLWNEPGAYGDQLRVYDRAGQPCRRCGNPVRRIVQGQRSTFFCPECQRRVQPGRGARHRRPAHLVIARGRPDP